MISALSENGGAELQGRGQLCVHNTARSYSGRRENSLHALFRVRRPRRGICRQTRRVHRSRFRCQTWNCSWHTSVSPQRENKYVKAASKARSGASSKESWINLRIIPPSADAVRRELYQRSNKIIWPRCHTSLPFQDTLSV